MALEAAIYTARLNIIASSKGQFMFCESLDKKLSSGFRVALGTGVLMLISALAGLAIAKYIEYRIGYLVVLISVSVGIICIIICVAMRFIGKHVKNI